MNEKNKKNIVGLAVAILIALAMVMPMSTASTNDVENPIPLRNYIREYTLIDAVRSYSRSDNIPVSNTPGDDVIPGITRDAAGNTVVTWTNKEDSFTWNMGIAYSSTPTNPNSWNGYIIGLQGTTMVYSSDTAFVIGPNPSDYTGLFGVNMYYDTEQVGYYQIPDITTDPSTWEFYYWQNPAYNPTYATIEDGGYYYEPYYDRWGVVNMFIYHWDYMGYNIEDCPMYFLTDPAGGGATMFFDAQDRLWTAPAKEPSLAMLPDWFHLTWEYRNSTAGKDQIVWKKIDAAVEADIEFTPFQKYVAEGKNPEIAAYKDGSAYHVAIAYVDGGNVKCVSSSDDGGNWSGPVTIAAGSYPALCAIGTKLYCTYINAGNLFLKISEDGGATWGVAEQINDEDGKVSAEENSVDIHNAGIVWVDTRNGQKQIYYAALAGVNQPPNKPEITGPASGKPRVELEYTFQTTDPEGDDVFYYVDWGDETTSGWQGPYESGEEVTFKHKWTKRGTYTIRCKAKDTNTAESAWGTLTITMPTSYNMPLYWFLQRLLERFPNAFPLLRHFMQC